MKNSTKTSNWSQAVQAQAKVASGEGERRFKVTLRRKDPETGIYPIDCEGGQIGEAIHVSGDTGPFYYTDDSGVTTRFFRTMQLLKLTIEREKVAAHKATLAK